jgi:Plasma-membrane choline transporter
MYAYIHIHIRLTQTYIHIHFLLFSSMDVNVRSVLALFRERGWMTVLNDDIIASVLFLGPCLIGFLCTVVAYLYAKAVDSNSINTLLLSFLGFYSGFFMCSTTVKIIASSVATVYVCWAEKPELFEVAHPELHMQLMGAWVGCYPTLAPRGEGAYDPNSYTAGIYIAPSADISAPSSYKPVAIRDDDDDVNGESAHGAGVSSRAERDPTGRSAAGVGSGLSTVNTLFGHLTGMVTGTSKPLAEDNEQDEETVEF